MIILTDKTLRDVGLDAATAIALLAPAERELVVHVRQQLEGEVAPPVSQGDPDTPPHPAASPGVSSPVTAPVSTDSSSAHNPREPSPGELQQVDEHPEPAVTRSEIRPCAAVQVGQAQHAEQAGASGPLVNTGGPHMSALMPNPIDPAALAGLVMTPRQPDDARCGSVHDAPTSRTFAAIAALEPRPEDAPEPVVLLLDANEVQAIKVRAERLAQAAKAAEATEQRLVAAQSLALKLASVDAHAGALAVRACDDAMVDKRAVAELNAQHAERCEAEQALPTLRREAEEARRQRDAAYSATRGLVNQCMSNLRLRAAAEYGRLATEMTRCVAVVGATIEMQTPVEDLFTAWHGQFLGELRVPAMPEPLRDARAAEVECHHFRDMLLIVGHSRLSANESATRSRLHQQLQAALAPAGLRSANVL